MFRTFALLLSSSVLVAGAAIAQPSPQTNPNPPKPGENTNAVSAAEDAVGGVVGKMTASITGTAKGFVDAAAISDMYEIEAGKMAAARASDPKLKAFASDMIKAHTETSAALKAALPGSGANVTPPVKVDARRQGMLDNLSGASAADFDARYIAQQVAAHDEALALMREYAKDGDNAALKKLAHETAPKVQGHLSHIKAIQKAHEIQNARESEKKM